VSVATAGPNLDLIDGQSSTFVIYLPAGKRAYWHCDLLSIVFHIEGRSCEQFPAMISEICSRSMHARADLVSSTIARLGC
jgi:hypothetical protein